jgi:hypothetical protein
MVHVLDLASGTAYTAVTPAMGGFMRLVPLRNKIARLGADSLVKTRFRRNLLVPPSLRF